MARVLHANNGGSAGGSSDYVLKPALAAKIANRVKLLACARSGLLALSLPALTARLRRLRSDSGNEGAESDEDGRSMPGWWCGLGGTLDIALLRAVSRHGFVGWSVLCVDETLPFERAGRRAAARAAEAAAAVSGGDGAVKLPSKEALEARVEKLVAALPQLALSAKPGRKPSAAPTSPNCSARSGGLSPPVPQRSPRLAKQQEGGSKRPSPVAEQKPSAGKKQKLLQKKAKSQDVSGSSGAGTKSILSFFNRK